MKKRVTDGSTGGQEGIDHPFPAPTGEELEGIMGVLRQLGSSSTQWSPHDKLEVLIAARRLSADAAAANRVVRVTWALVVATIGLVVATIALVVVTIAN